MFRFRRAAGALGAVVLTLCSTGVAVAADESQPARTLHIRIVDDEGQPIAGSLATLLAPGDQEMPATVLRDWSHYAVLHGDEVTLTAVAPAYDVTVIDLFLPAGLTEARVDVDAASGSYNVLPQAWTTDVGTPLPLRDIPASAEDGEGPIVCMIGQIPEGEPDCFDGYVDEFNGGFNSDPSVFSDIECTNIICGRFGTYETAGMPQRDTDWYRLDLTFAAEVTWEATATVGHAVTTLNEAGFVVGSFAISQGGESISVTNTLEPGIWYVFIAPSAFAGVPCPSSYVAELTCVPVADPLMVTADDAVLCPGETASTCAVATGGTPPFTYAWTGPGGFTAGTECITVSVPGIYSVTVTDSAQETASDDAVITLSDLAVTVDDATVCQGDTYEFCANATGGTPPYAYAWTGPGGFTADTMCITVGTPGTYSVTVTDLDNEGCQATDDATLTVTSPDVVVEDATVCVEEMHTFCPTVTGGTPPFTYDWTGPGGFTATTECITVGTPGTYILTVTDALQCIGSDDATLSFGALEVTVDDATICEGQTHQFCPTVIGGTPPYTYAWTGPGGFTAGTECITVGTPGMYSVTVTDQDGEGCNGSDSAILTVTTITVTVDDETICEGETHQFCPTVVGGTAPLSYAWTGPGGFTAATECITVGTAGVYALTVTDDNGCTGTDDATLTVTTIDVTVDDETICENQTHMFCPTIIGGTTPLTYAWTGPGGFTAATECITVGDAGIYALTVTDDNGCVGTAMATLSVTTITAMVDDATICSGETHMFCATVVGGTPPLTYFWSTGESGECITVDTAGLYTVTVTDANGCSSGAGATLTVTTITATVDDATICEGQTHQFCPTVTGGTGMLTYAWTGPGGFTADTECITVDIAGDYALTVTDANDCMATADATLTVTTISVVVDDATVCEGQSHEFCPTVTGGTAPYVYAWTGPGGFTADTECITVDVAGTYTLTVFDDLQCSGTDSAVLTIGSLNVTLDDATICEGAEHEFCPTLTGGTPPFVYAWTGPFGFTADTECITVDVPGVYQVTVTDQDGQGCSGMDDATLTEVEVVAIVDDATICDGATHEFCPTVTGGTPPLTYAWTGPGGFTADTECITVDAAGDYELTVTDANGCFDDTTATLTVTEITVTVDDATICEGADHEFCPTVIGGTAPLTYAWTGPGGFTADTECITVDVAGDYALTVTDASDCFDSTTATLTVTEITVTVDDATICDGAPHEFCPTVIGGTAPLTYAWTGPGGFTADTECITVDVAGDYALTVTDANDCFDSTTATLTVTEIAVTVDDATICDGATHEFCPTVTGGTAPLTYAWTGPGGFTADTECITVGEAGDYALTVTDANACTAEATATLTVTEIAAAVDDATICDRATHEFCPTVLGGTPPYAYAWTGPGGFTADTECITVDEAGDYALTVTDDNLCVANAVATLTVVTIEVAVNDATICEGDPAAEFCATVTGGTPPYTYEWRTAENTECISVTTADDYCVIVTDAAGCTGTACGTLTVNDPPTVTLTAPDPQPVCESEGNLLTAEIVGGTPPYNISWTVTGDPGWAITGGQDTATITYTAGANGTSAQFEIFVTDAAGCLGIGDTAVTVTCSGECELEIECDAEFVQGSGSSGSASGSEGSSSSSGNSGSSASGSSGSSCDGSSEASDPDDGYSGGSASGSVGSSDSGMSGSSESGSSGSSASGSSAASDSGGSGGSPGQRIRVAWEVTGTCEPFETTAVIDIGCEVVEVTNGQILDLVCVCHDDHDDSATAADGSGSSGSGSESGASSGSHGSGSAGDCGCPSGASGSSASGSSLSSSGSYGEDAAADYGSSKSGLGSGSSSASNSSGGGEPCCIAIPGEGEHPLLIASSTAVLIVTVVDAQGNTEVCELDLCSFEPSAPVNLCPGDGVRPAILSMEYTSASCDATSHGQDRCKVECNQFIGVLPMNAYILGTSEEYGGGNALVWFEGWVSLGQGFDLTAGNADRDRLKKTTYVHVLDGPGGTLLQTTEFHTSCSQPLAEGDQYGASRLVGFVADAGLPGDVNADGVVNFTDLMQVLSAWGPCVDCYEDLDENGDVNMADAFMVMEAMN